MASPFTVRKEARSSAENKGQEEVLEVRGRNEVMGEGMDRNGGMTVAAQEFVFKAGAGSMVHVQLGMQVCSSQS